MLLWIGAELSELEAENAKDVNEPLIIVTIISIKKTKYLPEEYSDLKFLFETAAHKLQDQIVLKKS